MPKVIIDGRWRVFLSSTFRELEEYRREVRQQCKQNLRQQIDLVALDDEQYSRHSLDAGLLSAEKVKSCDLVLLLIGRELGSRSASGESQTSGSALCETCGFCTALSIFHREEVSRYGNQQKILRYGAPMDEES